MTTNITTPRIDCHIHVVDPARFPYTPGVFYRPEGAEIATATQLRFVLEAHNVQHALLVNPNSGYGLDNRCMLDAVENSGGLFKGVAVVRNDAGREELQDLQGSNIIGIAFQVALLGIDFYRDIGPLLARLHDLGMWAQFQVEGDQLVELKPMLLDSGVNLLFDHCGRPFPDKGLGQPGFEALLSIADTRRAVVKLSSLTKSSALPYPHEDAWPFVRALIDAYTPEFLVWASDWPFLRAPARIDYGPLLTLMERLIPDEKSQRAIMWDTPKRLFGFKDSRSVT